VIRAETEGEIIVVLANRCGSEEEATYAGTSAVLGIQGGEVKVYGILGRSENELLVVDTNKRPAAKLVSIANSAVSNASEATTAESTFSNKSDASGLTLNTACTSPSLDMTMAGIMSPVLPADPSSPNAYFTKGNVPDPGTLRDILKSSIAEPGVQSVFPDPSALVRPPSPKSRNASRTRQPDEKEQAVIHALLDSTTFERQPIEEEQVSTPALPDPATLQRQSVEKEQVLTPALPDSPTLKRPPSPKSRNASRTRQPDQLKPTLASHNLAEEEQSHHKSVRVRSPQHSAGSSLERYQTSFTNHTFGSRREYITPRPKSAVW